MRYEYRKERERLFTEEGQRIFLEIRDRVQRLLRQAGACTMGKAIDGSTGDTWFKLACVEQLVELGEIVEVTQGQDLRIQHRVYREKEGRGGKPCRPSKKSSMCS